MKQDMKTLQACKPRQAFLDGTADFVVNLADLPKLTEEQARELLDSNVLTSGTGGQTPGGSHRFLELPHQPPSCDPHLPQGDNCLSPPLETLPGPPRGFGHWRRKPESLIKTRNDPWKNVWRKSS